MSVAESNYQAWIAKAESDVLNIENNLAADRVPWDTVCFHAQQAGEKFLKALLVYHGQRAPHIHDLVPLHTGCTDIDTGLEVSDRGATIRAGASGTRGLAVHAGSRLGADSRPPLAVGGTGRATSRRDLARAYARPTERSTPVASGAGNLRRHAQPADG